MLFVGDVFRLDDDSRAIDPTLEYRWAEWVKTLGLDPNELLRDAVIRVNHQSNKYELHVSKIRRDANGDRCYDTAASTLVSDPLVVPLDGKDWPETLPFREQVAV